MKPSKRLIHKACKLLEEGYTIWSCMAIWDADTVYGYRGHIYGNKYVQAYSKFYKKDMYTPWKLKYADKHTRIMLLLNWLESNDTIEQEK